MILTGIRISRTRVPHRVWWLLMARGRILRSSIPVPCDHTATQAICVVGATGDRSLKMQLQLDPRAPSRGVDWSRPTPLLPLLLLLLALPLPDDAAGAASDGAQQEHDLRPWLQRALAGSDVSQENIDETASILESAGFESARSLRRSDPTVCALVEREAAGSALTRGC